MLRERTGEAMKNYYEVLGCTRKATEKELRLAFKKKALKLHPDVNPNNRQKAERLFKEANTAFQVLSDEKKRREYDLEFFTQGEDQVHYADEDYDREEEEYPREREASEPGAREYYADEDEDRREEDFPRESESQHQSSPKEPSRQAPRQAQRQAPRQATGSTGSTRKSRAARRVRDAASWAAKQSPDDDGTQPRPTVSSVIEDLLRRPTMTPSPCNICQGSGRVSQARNYVITTIPCPHCVRAASR